MDETLLWALNNERAVFGNWYEAAEAQSEKAFECIVRAVEEANKCDGNEQQKRRIVVRKSRNLFIDHQRKVRGVVKNPDGSRGFSTRETSIDRPEDELTEQILEALSTTTGVDEELLEAECRESVPSPEVVHATLRAEFPPEVVKIFEMSMQGYTSKAIGIHLGLTAENVRKRWERARPSLARRLAELIGFEEDYALKLLGARSRSSRGGRSDANGRNER